MLARKRFLCLKNHSVVGVLYNNTTDTLYRNIDPSIEISNIETLHVQARVSHSAPSGLVLIFVNSYFWNFVIRDIEAIFGNLSVTLGDFRNTRYWRYSG